MLRCCVTVRAGWSASLTCYVAMLLSGRREAEGGGMGRRQRPEQERLRRQTDCPGQGRAG